MGERGNAPKCLVRRPAGKRPLARPRPVRQYYSEEYSPLGSNAVKSSRTRKKEAEGRVACFLLVFACLFFDPEDGSSTFLRIVRELLPTTCC
jgi:hypothetical protein